MNDAELVALARQGDTSAFGELVDRHRMAVYRAALAALGSHAEAEDAAQDAFITAYRKLSGFRGDASFKTWLLTIAWHHAINRRRWLRFTPRLAGARSGQAGRARQEGQEGQDPSARCARSAQAGRERQEGRDGQERFVDNGRSPERIALDRELGSAIVNEIRALAPKLRDALLLAQSGEYRYEEIASMLGVPIGTVKWRVSEARKVVRRGLSARGFEDV